MSQLLVDLSTEAVKYGGSELKSVYFGGGTPSLLPPKIINRIVQAIKNSFKLSESIEISLEANPGAIDKLDSFKEAGVNRISLGVQSFNDQHLKQIGRIHDSFTAKAAIDAVKQVGFNSFNIDLMYGLPGQSVSEVKEDVETALSFEPFHISWYNLTIEPKTFFGLNLPKDLPDAEKLWKMQQVGQKTIESFGLKQYEVTAFAESLAHKCKHNLNYWEYGDYIGIGAGAHSKITSENFKIVRYWKLFDPQAYMAAENLIEGSEVIDSEQLPLDFMINALRLYKPMSFELFESRTGAKISAIRKRVLEAQKMGLLELDSGYVIVTDFGRNFLNNLLEIFS